MSEPAGILLGMDSDGFWHLIDNAREQADENAEAVAEKAADLLAAMPAEEIVSAQQRLWDQLALSYTAPLWAAAYIINGGCSDDGFEYFRGWLITQGRETFQRALADPDSLADHPPVQAAAAECTDGIECELALRIAYDAHERATGEPIPQDVRHIAYPALGGDFWFDFEDSERLDRMLPRLSALYASEADA